MKSISGKMCDAIYTIVLAKRKKNALDKKKKEHDNTYIFLIFSYIKEKKNPSPIRYT